MSIVDVATFKTYIRELSDDLDDAFQMALDSASAETIHYLGFDPVDSNGSAEPDIAMACMLLAQIHADMGDPDQNDHRRVAAQRLLTPYRLNTGFGATEVAA